jgi:hypothetical protein
MADQSDTPARTPQSPERYHEENHVRRGRAAFTDCWDCQRARALCRSKRRFDSREAADAAVTELNESRAYERPVVRYRCRWCPGWHLTTARSKVRVKRAEKQRRKWLRREVA